MDENGDATDSTYPSTDQPKEYSSPKSRTTSSPFELIYATASGFIIGFLVAGGIGIILLYAIKATEGLDGE